LQAQSRDRGWIAGQLWIDSSEQRAYANLRSALWRMRRLGGGLIRRVGPQLKLTAQVELDIVRFEAGARRGLPETAADPRTAIDLFTRELLPEWTEDWVLGERERLRQIGMHALEALALELVECGQGADAVEVALAAVQMEPSRESAQRALIIAHAAEGNYPDALRQYERYRAYLREELGLTPSPQFRALLRDLVGLRREAA
jgi:DNA-binding SARP family transcriptional activator